MLSTALKGQNKEKDVGNCSIQKEIARSGFQYHPVQYYKVRKLMQGFSIIFILFKNGMWL